MNTLRSFILVLAAGFAANTPAYGQGAIMAGLPDVLGQTIGRAGSGWPAWCLALEQQPNENDITRFAAGADIGIQRYLAIAATGVDPSPAYKRNWSKPWQLDGAIVENRALIADPWAARVTRLEPVAIELGSSKVFGRGVWRAFEEDGNLLGYYDAEMIRQSKDYAIGRLELWSPDRSGEARTVTPFCAEPGDHRQYLEGNRDFARQRFEKAGTEAAEAANALAADPARSSLVRRAERAQAKAEERRAALDQAETRLATAAAAQQAAQAIYGTADSEGR